MGFWQSIFEHFKHRTTSSLIGTFVVFWFFFHWQAAYVTLFVNQEYISQKYGMLKNEYINRNFIQPNFSDPGFYLSYILPIAFTYIFIWILPKLILMPAFKEENKYKTDKRIIVLKEKERIRTEEVKLAEKDADIKVQEARSVEAEQVIMDIAPEKSYKKDFANFVQYRNNGLDLLNEIMDSVYSHDGLISSYYYPENSSQQEHFRISKEALAAADTSGLIEIDYTDPTTIKLTDKGKYFISRLT